jgi:hypothetical protein
MLPFGNCKYCVPPPPLTEPLKNAIPVVKFAVTVSGALIVTVVEALLGLATLPVQLAKE